MSDIILLIYFWFYYTHPMHHYISGAQFMEVVGEGKRFEYEKVLMKYEKQVSEAEYSVFGRPTFLHTHTSVVNHEDMDS